MKKFFTVILIIALVWIGLEYLCEFSLIMLILALL